MRTSVLVVDNFYRRPDAVRSYALGCNYYFPYQSREQVERGEPPAWLASEFLEAKECPFKSSEALIKALEEVTGEQIDREHWNRSFPVDLEGRPAARCENDPARGCLWNCSFHFKPQTGQRLGEGVHNHVTDIWNSVGVNGWAGLIYLNRSAPLSAGLHLWQNKDVARNFDWMTDRSNWDLHDSFANVFNRLLLVRGDVPHSGADGWANSMLTGRFYQTFFFRVTGSSSRRSLGIDL